MKRKYNEGFTIIELVISLSLIVISTSIILGYIKFSEKRDLYIMAMELRNDIRYAQLMAISENREYRVKFNLMENSYKLEKLKNGEWEFIKKIYFRKSIEECLINAKGGMIKFTCKGTTSTPCTINLIGMNNYINLTVNLGSGKVNIGEINRLQ